MFPSVGRHFWFWHIICSGTTNHRFFHTGIKFDDEYTSVILGQTMEVPKIDNLSTIIPAATISIMILSKKLCLNPVNAR